MGLDMFLFRRKKGEAELPVTEEVYWRKANQIRQWIVDHTLYPVDADCKPFVLEREQLEALVADCRMVLNDHKLAAEIIPTSEGFFFGSTEYDEWYFNNLERTEREVSELIARTNFDEEEIVYYEWY